MRRNSFTLVSYYYRLRSPPYVYCFHCHRKLTFESSFVLIPVAFVSLSLSSSPAIWLRTKNRIDAILIVLNKLCFCSYLRFYQLLQLRLWLNYARTTFLWSLHEANDDVRSSRYFEAIDLWILMKFIFINRKLLHNLCFNDRRRSQHWMCEKSTSIRYFMFARVRAEFPMHNTFAHKTKNQKLTEMSFVSMLHSCVQFRFRWLSLSRR